MSRTLGRARAPAASAPRAGAGTAALSARPASSHPVSRAESLKLLRWSFTVAAEYRRTADTIAPWCPELRRAYNAAFTDQAYRALVAELERASGVEIEFRISETPIFLPAELTAEMERAAWEIFGAVSDPAYLARSGGGHSAGPRGAGRRRRARLPAGGPGAGPGRGRGIAPRLIELQAFPSLYGFQWLIARGYQRHFPAVPDDWTPYFSGFDDPTYVACLRDVIVADCDPEQVVLLDVEPEKQKTKVDFAMTEKLLGLRTVDAARVERRGRRLFYRDAGGREVEIRRIYNRVIFDEVERKGIDVSQVFGAEIDAEWVGHPDWFYRISKWSLPHISSPYCPPCRFVSDLTAPPADLENYVLKPIFSFAGLGVEVDLTAEKLGRLRDPENWILQRKVEYAPVVETPDGRAKVEVRMMFVRRAGQPLLVNSLVRTSKGKMLGVNFNKDQAWIGASVAFHPP